MKHIKHLKYDTKKDTFLLIDICGTYVTENTTIGLLKSHFSILTFKGLVVRLLTIKLSPLRIILLLIEKITGYYFLKNLLILLISGVSVSSLEKTSMIYAKKLIKEKKYNNQEVVNFIKSHIAKSNPIFISASIEPIVKAISSIEKIPYVASTIEHIDNKYTGRISKDITRKKNIELMNKFNINANDIKYYLVTNNFEDLDLAKNSIETLFIRSKKKIYLNKNLMNQTNLKFVNL